MQARAAPFQPARKGAPSAGAWVPQPKPRYMANSAPAAASRHRQHRKKACRKGRLPYFNTIVTTLIKNHAKNQNKIGLNIKKKAAKKAAFFV